MAGNIEGTISIEKVCVAWWLPSKNHVKFILFANLKTKNDGMGDC